MDASLYPRIRAALAGTSSKQSVPEEKLLELGDPEEVRTNLAVLYAQFSINKCSITRDSVTSVVWWETGVVRSTGPQVNPHSANAPQRVPVARTTSRNATESGEKVMSQGRQQGTSQTIIELIGKKPGMLMTEIHKQLPEISAANLSQHLLMLKKKGKIETRGNRGLYTYHPTLPENVSAPQPAADPSHDATAPAVVPAKPDVLVHAGLEEGRRSGNFSAMLDHENNLHIGVSEEMFMLKPHQAIILKAFLNRITLDDAEEAA